MKHLEITLRHLDHTESIDLKIRQKLERLQKKHFTPGATFQWTSWPDGAEFITTLKAHDKGRDYFVKTTADTLYKTIDLVTHKLEAQIERHGPHRPKGEFRMRALRA